jgi:hypothetical protein
MLNEILLTRPSTEIHLLKAAFQASYKRDLATFVAGDLSGKVERRMLHSCVPLPIFFR